VVFGGEPQGQIENNTGKEACLGRAKQHADQVEAVLVAEPGDAGDGGGERHHARDNSPTQHDTGDPFARAESFEQEVGGHLEDEICDEEDARAEAERGLRQAKVLVHRERGKAHIHPVQIGDEVADDQERHQSLGDLRDGADFYSLHGIGPAGLCLANI
jgi:hypothetical protein